MTNERKPRGYWTKERLQVEALKFKTKKEFELNSKSAYTLATRKGWLDEICNHMKGNIQWTIDLCKVEALKHTTIKAFREKSPKAYDAAVRNKWLDIVCEHLERTIHPNNYWTKERCKEVIDKYTSYSELSKDGNHSVINAVRFNGWEEDLFATLSFRETKSRNYWTKARCQLEAFKYPYKSLFQLLSNGAYNAAKRNGWLKEICINMIPKGERLQDEVYLYVVIFPDIKEVYVGLTNDLTRRQYEHLRIDLHNGEKSNENLTAALRSEARHRWKTCCKVGINEAEDAENKMIEFFISKGYKKHNIAKAGSLGGTIKKWTKKELFNKAAEFEDRREFRLKVGYVYNRLSLNGWLTEATAHMPVKNVHPPGFWTKENCRMEALMYSSRTKFAKGSKTAYNKAQKNGCLDEICQHMTGNHNWTIEDCREIASKCKSRKEFELMNKNAYQAAARRKWLDEICAHMDKKEVHPKDYWNDKSRCISAISKCTHIHEFKTRFPGAFSSIKRNKWEDELFSKLKKRKSNPPGYWSIEKCRKKASDFHSITAFRLAHPGGYNAAQRNGWLDSIFKRA